MDVSQLINRLKENNWDWNVIAREDEKYLKRFVVNKDYESGLWYVREKVNLKNASEVEDNVILYQTKFDKSNINIIGKKGNLAVVSKKLNRFINETNYDWDTILGATDMYIQSLNNTKFCKRSDYFIYKREDGTKDSEVSLLLEWCEIYIEKNINNGYSEVIYDR